MTDSTTYNRNATLLSREAFDAIFSEHFQKDLDDHDRVVIGKARDAITSNYTTAGLAAGTLLGYLPFRNVASAVWNNRGLPYIPVLFAKPGTKVVPRPLRQVVLLSMALSLAGVSIGANFGMYLGILKAEQIIAREGDVDKYNAVFKKIQQEIRTQIQQQNPGGLPSGGPRGMPPPVITPGNTPDENGDFTSPKEDVPWYQKDDSEEAQQIKTAWDRLRETNQQKIVEDQKELEERKKTKVALEGKPGASEDQILNDLRRREFEALMEKERQGGDDSLNDSKWR